MAHHTAYTVELEKYDAGYNPDTMPYDPEKITDAEFDAPEGIDEGQAYEMALDKYPGYIIVGHHIRWWD